MWILTYFLLHLLVYLGLRLQFLIWNWASLKTLSVSDILIAFLYGVRFDLAALSIPVGIFCLGWIWLQRASPFSRKSWLCFFTVLHCFLIVLNYGDAELLNFTARRFTKSSFFLFNEAQASNIVTPYVGMFFVTIFSWALYSYLVYRLLWAPKKSGQAPLSPATPVSLFKKAGLSFGILVVTVILSRGGLQVKPLTFVDAKIFDQSYANNLVLNSTFTLVKSFGKPSVERIHYFDNEKMLSLLNQQELPSTFSLNAKRTVPLNVVYIFLESFSKEYTNLQNPEVTPFLNSLRQQGKDFVHAYANGRRSIEGVAALLSGIPALMEEPFINSEFSANQVIGLGTLLAAENYHTSFFHGARNGSMHFDQFMRSVGIENYFGKNEYPNQGDNDGTWGIFDEPFLQWTCGKISEFKEPFFTSIFTLTSHQPFKIPEQYKDRFKDERLPILKSIQYADFALQRFMECAEKQKWYTNTLFIFTADHTGPELQQEASFESQFDHQLDSQLDSQFDSRFADSFEIRFENRFTVPLVFFSPSVEVLKDLKTDQYAQHIDILPTLLETLQIPLKNKNHLARSLWQPGPKVIALYTDGKYQLVGQVRDKTEQLKAIQQYFSEGLFDNRLYYPSK